MKQATAKELEQMIIGEFDKIEDCRGVKSVGIQAMNQPDFPNWNPNVINFGEADPRLCKSALPGILKKLHAEYELVADNT
jgi:hypothetical protein